MMGSSELSSYATVADIINWRSTAVTPHHRPFIKLYQHSLIISYIDYNNSNDAQCMWSTVAQLSNHLHICFCKQKFLHVKV